MCGFVCGVTCVGCLSHNHYFKGSKGADTSEHKIVELWGPGVGGLWPRSQRDPTGGQYNVLLGAQPGRKLGPEPECGWLSCCHIHRSGLTLFVFTETQTLKLLTRERDIGLPVKDVRGLGAGHTHTGSRSSPPPSRPAPQPGGLLRLSPGATCLQPGCLGLPPCGDIRPV